MHICIGNLPITDSDNGLSPSLRQAIIWTNAGILLIGTLRTNFSENFNQNHNIFIQENAFESVWETAASLPQPQCVNWTNDDQVSPHIASQGHNELSIKEKMMFYTT